MRHFRKALIGRSTTCRVVALLVVFGTAHLSNASRAQTTAPIDLKITIKFEPPGQEQFVAEVVLLGDHVLAFAGTVDDELDAVFNVKEHWWHDVGSDRRMSLSESQQWAEKSRQASKASIESEKDVKLRRFAAALVDPKFEVHEADGVLTLKNDALVYRVTALKKLEPEVAERFFAYDRLNAYHKAIVLRKMPPFPQLAVTDELRSRGVLPGQIILEIHAPRQVVEMRTEMALEPLAPEERQRAEEVLKKLK